MKSFNLIVISSLGAFLATTPASWAAPLDDGNCEQDAAGLKADETSFGTCMNKIILEQGFRLNEVANLVGGVEDVKSLYLGRARNDTDDELQAKIHFAQ
jgi:hypothetical protein